MDINFYDWIEELYRKCGEAGKGKKKETYYPWFLSGFYKNNF